MGAAHGMRAIWRSGRRRCACAVNVSPLQFANPQLPGIVTNAIAQAGIEPSRLELEITESVFLNDDEGTDAMFAALKNIGVRLALDDFGTGYSSLGYLKKAPFDKIKIDQSFVRGATVPGSRNGAIIASISSLAQALGMDTTAEGVETLDELDLVRMHGCSHVQGYIYERPLDSEAATATARDRTFGCRPGTAFCPCAAADARCARSCSTTMGRCINGTVRNISASGALIEGLWNVPGRNCLRNPAFEGNECDGHHTLVPQWTHGSRVRRADRARERRTFCRLRRTTSRDAASVVAPGELKTGSCNQARLSNNLSQFVYPEPSSIRLCKAVCRSWSSRNGDARIPRRIRRQSRRRRRCVREERRQAGRADRHGRRHKSAADCSMTSKLAASAWFWATDDTEPPDLSLARCCSDIPAIP